MPTFEYYCNYCKSLFEDLLMGKDEIEKYSKSHPCIKCGKLAKRVPSVMNFKLTGVAEGDPTKVGNSGFHGLDYPHGDLSIGRSANRKWKEYEKKKEIRDKFRKEHGTNAIGVNGDKPISIDQKNLEIREKAFKLLKKAKES